MWSWQNLAADLPPAPAPTDNTQFYLVFAASALASLALVLVAVINNRSNRTAPSPPAPAGDVDADGKLRERVAVNEATLAGLKGAVEDLEDSFNILDRRQARGEQRAENHSDRITRLERLWEERPDAE